MFFYYFVACHRSIYALIKNKIEFLSNIRKFKMEHLQSHIWLTASSYMGTYLRISSYIRNPSLIYDFATAPFWISLNIRKIWFSFLSVCTVLWIKGSLCLIYQGSFLNWRHWRGAARTWYKSFQHSSFSYITCNAVPAFATCADSKLFQPASKASFFKLSWLQAFSIFSSQFFCISTK